MKGGIRNISEPEFIMKPKVDFVFKELMQDPAVRIGFLSAVLDVDPQDIRQTTILNAELRRRFQEDKLGILDVRLSVKIGGRAAENMESAEKNAEKAEKTGNAGQAENVKKTEEAERAEEDDGGKEIQIDVEIQLIGLKIWAKRSLYYLAKMYTDQIHYGDSYNVLKKCVSISILDFVLLKESREYYSRFRLLEENRHTPYTDDAEFHLIELPKLPEEEPQEGGEELLLWAKFFHAERKEELEMLAEKSESIRKAYRILQGISRDKRKRMEYEAREKAIRDHRQMIQEALEEGRELGRSEGVEIGRSEGVEMGRLGMLFDLVNDGILTIPAAAKKAKMDLSEFERKYHGSRQQLQERAAEF